MIRIHYIEDNLIDQSAFTREIEKKSLPYLVEFSPTLSEARKKKSLFDIVLCDFYLPDGTIIDLLPELGKDRAPVIVLTGLADLHNAVSALKLGAKDYLVKDTSRQYLELLPLHINNLIHTQQIEEERRWLSALFYSVAETIPFGLYLYEPEKDRVVYRNKAFLSLWDLPELQSASVHTHSYIKQYISEMTEPAGDGICIFPKGGFIERDEHSDGEISVRGNRTIRFFTTPIPLDPGASPCFVSIFEDTTELTRARSALYQYSLELESLNAHLDQRVHERTQQIHVLLKKKSDLMVNIGHDLRTPLTPLIALLPYLYDHESDPGKKRILSILCDGAKKIRSLADASLRIDHLENEIFQITNSGEICSCNIGQMMEEILLAYLPSIEKKNIRITNKTPSDITIRIKESHLHLILDNIIQNAVQYTNPGGTIDLNGGTDKDSSIWFCITDSGVGLSQEDTARIFDEFYKVDTARNNLDTHGVGLSVVKKLIILNEGHITVKSGGLGRGSRFCVSLPADCSPPPERKFQSTIPITF